MTDDPRNGGLRADRALERRLEAIPAEVSDALGVRVRAALEAVQDRTSGSLEGLRSALAGVEERLAGSHAALSERLEDLPGSTRGVVDSGIERIRSDLETVQSLPQQMARALTMVRDAMTEIAAAQEVVGERIGELSGDLSGKLAEEVSALLERRLEHRLDAILHLIDARLPEPPRKRRWWGRRQ